MAKKKRPPPDPVATQPPPPGRELTAGEEMKILVSQLNAKFALRGPIDDVVSGEETVGVATGEEYDPDGD